MNITIVGAGAVGLNLARELSGEKHEISVIEPDAALIQRLRERVDVNTVAGSGTDVGALREARAGDADVFIAVTKVDEINIVSCAMAHALGARRRIARVRNPSLSHADALVSKREFKINRIVNPDDLAAEAALHLIESPGVQFRAEFAEGEIQMRAFKVPADSGIDGVPLAELTKRYKQRIFLVVAIEREGRIIVPRGQDVLKVDDTVYLLMLRKAEFEFRKLLHRDSYDVDTVVVYGASAIGVDLARRLPDVCHRAILVEEDRARAEAAAANISEATVLHGWIGSEDVLREVRFGEVDVFVAASANDNMNVVAALFARQHGADRTLVLSREPEMVPLLQTLEFDAVINEHLLAVSDISRFLRPGKVLSVHKIGTGEAEAIELLVRKGSKAADKSLRDLDLPEGAIVGAVFRDGQAFLPTGDTVLEEGDDIVAFVLREVREKVERLFASGRKIRFEQGD